MNKSWKVTLSDAMGDLQDPSIATTVDTYLWVIESVSVVLCLILFILAAKNISLNKYSQGLLSFFGGLLAGISPYMASVFFY
jgi:hypothetical protein